MKKTIFWILTTSGILVCGFVLVAYGRTWNKTELEIRLHINEKLVQESTFGEPPTFAIWIGEPGSGRAQTVFVTGRAGRGDWEGKAAVPVALPRWFEVNEKEKQAAQHPGTHVPDEMAISGATPTPGYFTTRVRVMPGKKLTCWMEVNLAGDFNASFPEFDVKNQTSDEYKTGQPALLYKAELQAEMGTEATPVIAGMAVLDSSGRVHILPPDGITTAKDIFDEITLRIIKPKPRIIDW